MPDLLDESVVTKMEETDKAIAKEVMGWSECAINNFDIPVPEYSSDRCCSSAVVEKIGHMQPRVISTFDEEINKYMEGIKKTLDHCKPSDFLLFITPDIICDAALHAVRLHKEESIPLHDDICRDVCK
jgi:hypothetical protein